MAFGVIGYTLSGQEILGEVMGGGGGGYAYDHLEGEDVDGDGVMGGGFDVVGARRRRAAGGGRRIMRIPPKPDWRAQLAPGVIQPDEGLVPLALAGQAGTPGGTFSAAVPVITFQGQLQKPYRSERLLVSTVRTGASAVGRLLGVLYVGTDLQQAEITGWDIELIGQANAFGTRLTCKAAEPGVFVRLVVTLSNVLTGTDTIFANCTFLGRVIH
jgi:hypothetical protein